MTAVTAQWTFTFRHVTNAEHRVVVGAPAILYYYNITYACYVCFVYLFRFFFLYIFFIVIYPCPYTPATIMRDNPWRNITIQ